MKQSNIFFIRFLNVLIECWIFNTISKGFSANYAINQGNTVSTVLSLFRTFWGEPHISYWFIDEKSTGEIVKGKLGPGLIKGTTTALVFAAVALLLVSVPYMSFLWISHTLRLKQIMTEQKDKIWERMLGGNSLRLACPPPQFVHQVTEIMCIVYVSCASAISKTTMKYFLSSIVHISCQLVKVTLRFVNVRYRILQVFFSSI